MLFRKLNKRFNPAKEIGKLWTYNKAGTREAYADLQTKIQELENWKKKYEPLIKTLEKEYRA